MTVRNRSISESICTITLNLIKKLLITVQPFPIPYENLLFLWTFYLWVYPDLYVESSIFREKKFPEQHLWTQRTEFVLFHLFMIISDQYFIYVRFQSDLIVYV